MLVINQNPKNGVPLDYLPGDKVWSPGDQPATVVSVRIRKTDKLYVEYDISVDGLGMFWVTAEQIKPRVEGDK